jgi:hypothetical protein
MLEGPALIEDLHGTLSDLLGSFLRADGLTLLLVGMLIGFAVAMALGSMARRRRGLARPESGQDVRDESSFGTIGRSMSA